MRDKLRYSVQDIRSINSGSQGTINLRREYDELVQDVYDLVASLLGVSTLKKSYLRPSNNLLSEGWLSCTCSRPRSRLIRPFDEPSKWPFM